MSDTAATGVLHGTMITLDSPIPSLEGKRVRVIVAPADDEVQLSVAEQTRLWEEWLQDGPQGPIEEGETSAFP